MTGHKYRLVICVDARRGYNDYMSAFTLFTEPTQYKLSKGRSMGWITSGVHLAPSTVSGVINVCPWSDGCEEPCLDTSGRGIFSIVRKARIRKTILFAEDRALFLKMFIANIEALLRYTKRKARKAHKRLRVAVRPNLTSDLAYYKFAPQIFAMFPQVQFYDYTKNPHTMAEFLRGELPPNYHLTYSRGKSSKPSDLMAIMRQGGNVAVVFDKLPNSYLGFPVINGDITDLRFMDNKGVVVGLTPKGKARKDKSGFVVRNYQEMTV